MKLCNINKFNFSVFKFNLIGLVNLGETSCMNSSIQILLHYKIFIDLLTKNFNKNNILSNCLTQLYNNQFNLDDYNFISPILFKEAFRKKHYLFSMGQHGSIEFLGIVLNGLKEEKNLVKDLIEYIEYESSKKIFKIWD